jgi:hypothetical protein
LAIDASSSVHLQGIDSSEIANTVHARRAPIRCADARRCDKTG